MLHPSYTELMERINKDVEEGDTPIVQSRYSIVKATADRAKQIIASRSISDKVEKDINTNPNMRLEAIMTKEQVLTQMRGEPLIANTEDMKPLSIAVEELYCGAVKIAERAENDYDSVASASDEETAESTEEDSDISDETSEVADKTEDVIVADSDNDKFDTDEDEVIDDDKKDEDNDEDDEDDEDDDDSDDDDKDED